MRDAFHVREWIEARLADGEGYEVWHRQLAQWSHTLIPTRHQPPLAAFCTVLTYRQGEERDGKEQAPLIQSSSAHEREEKSSAAMRRNDEQLVCMTISPHDAQGASGG